MSAIRHPSHGRPPMDVVEDAIHLLRRAPAWVHLVHLAPSAAFVLALLWFWSDMTRGVDADQRLASGAAGLALLYLGMKTAHAVHAAELRRLCADEPGRPWSLGRLARLARTQALLQPLAFVALPIAFLPLLLLPFPWLLAWFQSVSACGDEADGSVAACARHALRQAVAWPGQNHGVVGILLLVSTAVFLDVAVAIGFAPYLAHVLLGIESDFNLGMAAYLNTTFLLSLPALAYLVLDPLLKAIYVLRGFESDSIQTGADLLARLRMLGKSRQTGAGPARWVALLMVAAGLWAAGDPPLRAQSPSTDRPRQAPPTHASVDATRLGHDIRAVLDQAEYQWRAPRELTPEDPEGHRGEGPIRRWLRGLIKDFSGFANRNLDALFSAIGRVINFILGGFKPPSLPSGSTQVDWVSGLKLLAYVLLAAAVLGVAYLLVRLRRPLSTRAATASTTAPVAVPDLESDAVSADLLPEDGWLALASEKASLGEWRLALRAVYLGALAHLARREFLRLAPSKSNRDYLAELRRRARAFPVVPDRFQSCALRFERVWYGRHDATPGLLDEARADLDAMRRTASP